MSKRLYPNCRSEWIDGPRMNGISEGCFGAIQSSRQCSNNYGSQGAQLANSMTSWQLDIQGA